MSHILDASLAASGEKKIRWAASHMPVLAAIAAPYFANLKVTVPQAELVRKILHRLEKFEPIDPSLVPGSSLLREEFIK